MRKRRRIIFILSILILTAFTVICNRIQKEDAPDTIRFVCYADDGAGQQVSLFYDDGCYYAFLPSYSDLDSLRIEYAAGYRLFIDGELYGSGVECSRLSIDRTYSMSMTDSIGRNIASGELIIKRSENVPALSLNLTNGTIEEVHSDVPKKGYCFLIKADKSVDYYGEIKEIDGHGNSTWQQKKKSYNLQLSETADLLGMGSGNNWVLLANSFDESGLRNKIAFDFAKEIGVEFAVDSEYVDLYIDNVYYGLYLLAEKIEVGENRVDITDLEKENKAVNEFAMSRYPMNEQNTDGKIIRGYDTAMDPEDISGGYLFQVEHHYDRILEKKSVCYTDEMDFSLTSPKYASTGQIEYLSLYLQECENRLKNNDVSMIDVDSFAAYYLVHELFANTDNSSIFFYKEADSVDRRLHLCCSWDYDLAMGNSWRYPDANPEVLYRNSDNWFNYLYENEEFRKLLAQKYQALLDGGLLEEVDSRLSEYGDQIGSSFAMDKLRWKNIPSDSLWADESQLRFDSIDEHIAYISGFMSKRIPFLKSAWIDGQEYCRVSFLSEPGKSYKKEFYSVKKGEALECDPDPVPDGSGSEYQGYRFMGWYDAEGNEFSPENVINHDEDYAAAWENNNE